MSMFRRLLAFEALLLAVLAMTAPEFAEAQMWPPQPAPVDPAMLSRAVRHASRHVTMVTRGAPVWTFVAVAVAAAALTAATVLAAARYRNRPRAATS